MNKHKIYVTKPALPDFCDVVRELEKVWDSRILTNFGPYHNRFKKEISALLKVSHVEIFNNCTMGLYLALKSLNIPYGSQVITTPFTFVATAASILMNNLVPVFVDIEQDYFNLDPFKVRGLINSKTKLILPVHVYGNIANVTEFDKISNEYGIPVVYDGAHLMGAGDNLGNIYLNGEMTSLSFHATKVFNTFEGGAVVCKDAQQAEKIRRLSNFGFTGEDIIEEVGLNGKMSEFSAIVGLLQINKLAEYKTKRRMIYDYYASSITERAYILPNNISDPNYSYAILVLKENSRVSRDKLKDILDKAGIYTRKYFYPLLSDIKVINEKSITTDLEVALDISERILCLPIYPDLPLKQCASISNIINKYV